MYPSTMTGGFFENIHAIQIPKQPAREISAACISSLPNGEHFVVIAYQRGGLEGTLEKLDIGQGVKGRNGSLK